MRRPEQSPSIVPPGEARGFKPAAFTGQAQGPVERRFRLLSGPSQHAVNVLQPNILCRWVDVHRCLPDRRYRPWNLTAMVRRLDHPSPLSGNFTAYKKEIDLGEIVLSGSIP
jgi:hypothetical protein